MIKNIYLAICSLFFFMEPTWAQDAPFKIVTQEEQFYAYYQVSADKFHFSTGSKNTLTGGDVEFIKTLFKRMEVPYTIDVVPAEKIIPMLESGEADMALGIQKEKNILDVANYPKYPMRTRNYIFYGRKDDQLKSQKTSLTYKDVIGSRMLLGINVGFIYPSDFWEAFTYANNQLHPLLVEKNSYVENLRELKYKKIDLFIGDKERVDSYIDYYGDDDIIVPYRNILYWKDFFCPISKKSKYKNVTELMSKINRELYKMSEEGLQEKIQIEYIKKGIKMNDDAENHSK